MTRFKYIFLTFCVLGFLVPKAQDIQVLDLQSALSMGGASNLTLLELEEAVAVSRAESKISKNWWLPSLYAGTRLHQLWGTAMNTDGRFFQDLDRQNFWGGAGINFDLDLVQGVYDYKAQLYLERQVEVFTRAQRNQVLLNIVQAYYDLLSAQLRISVLGNLVTQTDIIAGEMAIQVEQGMRFESEVLLARSDVNRLKIEMLDAELAFGEISGLMVRLLNLAPGTRLVCGDSLLAPLDLGVQIPEQSSRFELQAQEYGLQSLQYQRKSVTKGLLLPEVRVGAYTSVFGDVFAPVDPTSAINASITWNIPLGSLLNGDQARMYNARIAQHEARTNLIKSQINQEVETAKIKRDISRSKMKLAEEGAGFAEEALSQSVLRQKAGTTVPFELVQTQEAFLRMTLAYLKAVADYNQAQFELKVAVGEDL